MKYVVALAVLLVPATVQASVTDGPDAAVAVTKCDPFSGGSLCASYDGQRLSAAQGLNQRHLALVSLPAHDAKLKAKPTL